VSGASHTLCPCCKRRVPVLVTVRRQGGREHTTARLSDHFETEGVVCPGSGRRVLKPKKGERS
jgi:hypothetical protein